MTSHPSNIEASVLKFIQLVAETHQLDEQELCKQWLELNPVDYAKFKVDELKVMCKQRGLLVTGTKKDLIARLKMPEQQGKLKVVKTKKKNPEDCKVIDRCISQSTWNVKRNEQGHYVDDSTGYVFDEISKAVIGHWQDNKLHPLETAHLSDCWSKGLSFRIPNQGVLADKTEHHFVNHDTREISRESHPNEPIAQLGVDYEEFW